MSKDSVREEVREQSEATTAAVNGGENSENNAYSDAQRDKIRQLVSNIYDIQKLRIATGQRIVSSLNIQMGQKPSMKKEDADKQAQKVMNDLKKEYKRITDAYVNKCYIISSDSNDGTNQYKNIQVNVNGRIDKVIESMAADDRVGIKYLRRRLDYDIMSTYVDLLHTEEKEVDILAKEIQKHPMWDKFFKNVVGVGPMMAGVCIAYFDIHKAPYASSFWKYAGLDTVEVTKEVEGPDGTKEKVPVYVMEQQKDENGELVFDENGEPVMVPKMEKRIIDGEMRSVPMVVREGRSARHLEKQTYMKDGEVHEKMGLTYNPKLKSKLIGVQAGNFLKQRGCYYEQIYRKYRQRLEESPRFENYTLGRINNMAKRYMIKCFVRDMWVVWREMAGYKVTAPHELSEYGHAPTEDNMRHYEAYMRTNGLDDADVKVPVEEVVTPGIH